MMTENQLEEMAKEPTVEEMVEEFMDRTSSHREAIETVIASLAENDSAMVQHTDAAYLWRFQYGSVEVFVQLSGESDDDLFTVWSWVLKLPARDELGLMRKLLEMNWSDTLETCFAIVNNQVVVRSQRTVAELSPGEISRAITLVAAIADNNDEALKEAFGSS
jgi:hypothetical protein